MKKSEVWHDTYENPTKRGSDLYFLYDDGKIDFYSRWSCCLDMRSYCCTVGCKAWAYASDILGGLQGNFCRYFYIERRSYGWVVFIKVEGLSNSVMIRQIKYVHEFQHILWAMGIDAGFEI